MSSFHLAVNFAFNSLKAKPGFSSLTVARTLLRNMKYRPRGFFGAPSLPVALPFLAGVFLTGFAGFTGSSTGSGSFSSSMGGSGSYYTGVCGFFLPPLFPLTAGILASSSTLGS